MPHVHRTSSGANQAAASHHDWSVTARISAAIIQMNVNAVSIGLLLICSSFIYSKYSYYTR